MNLFSQLPHPTNARHPERSAAESKDPDGLPLAHTLRPFLPIILLLLVTTHLPAQDFDGIPVKSRQYVTFLSADTTLPATKRTNLTLRFHVVDGYHVNSHKPFSDLQIPTNLTLQPSAGIKTTPADFPPGTTFTFAFDPKEKLSVYQGDFLVHIPITATVGSHQLLGTLHYQACDDKACYPPKSLPLTLTFTAK